MVKEKTTKIEPGRDPFSSYNLYLVELEIIELFQPLALDLNFLFAHPAKARTDSLSD
ncbi:MAG: hypothetical protein UX02_C0001G0345 [Candidatus Moranbacteria bacterium GW2011_GWC1_45_18]|nr:MAG: hypothetical protein UT79_C0002G0052 [Candidatus Moranbacteria bacterium GW2011_GWC2_40_12]KKT33798.1 MAG: hypothetical protein UW19_C0005G0044 [Candidatus Moranbacteria bacterium GW2011_GWF2_44_10]KKT70092.1 MAG: hypothetical protein UW66_C0052G0008 [Candidatus Moranbacteria bacterium GW2011_GWF1_44_4]KKU00897.1 MAG: hypothetical protein UX02_C0001G0345 [Candidatus Moranbacteria bacterium GW2011_GWC1_45_18]